MDEKERIETIMQKEEMTAAIFAAEIGIQGSTLSHILNGRNNPSLDVLRKILNRFRSISSDWLILGIGSMYRSELKSQAPTLFDNIDENISKSAPSDSQNTEKRIIQNNINQTSKVNNSDSKPVLNQQSSDSLNPAEFLVNKSVRKIIVYYNDNTFQEFVTK